MVYRIFVFLVCVVLLGCSTENASFLNRKYHGTTARYNGLFNANELIKGSLNTYYSSRKEDFFKVLPIQPLPTEEEVKGMLPALDTAIAKCTKVIRNHSMPSAEFMSSKEVEYNNWIDENWITIGKALYFKRDYKKASKNFEFTKKFFKDDPSTYVAELWLAKINVELKKYAKANLMLKSLIDLSKEQQKFSIKKLLSKFKKANPEEEKIPKIKRNLQFEIYKTAADVALKSKDEEMAAEMLKLAINKVNSNKEKARLSFILGQLYQGKGSLDSASLYFGKSVRPSASFEIAFNGKLNKAICSSGGGMERKLLSMAKDNKNAPYKDQIYYALAQVSLNQENKPQAVVYLTKSAFYSNNNKRQRAMAYEKLGDLRFDEKNYISAQKYYDSCSRFVDENYPKGDQIKNKAEKLSELVKYVEQAHFEDSVQRIAKMPEKERNDFVKDVLKKLKEEIQRKKELEAMRLLELQAQQGTKNNRNANKFIFNNTKLRDLGFQEFQRQWGPRENEDDWRRSNKIVFNETIEFDSDSNAVNVDSVITQEEDTLSFESLMAKIPLSDSSFQASILTLQEALYNSGLLYKDILDENSLAIAQFKKALDIGIHNLNDLSSAFQIYRIDNTSTDASKSKTHILTYYPDSDIARFLNDPDFFIRQKENKEQDQKNFLLLVEEYANNNYSTVLKRSDSIIEHNPENGLMAEYLMLNALAYGQIHEDKQGLLPRLERIINQKPGTEQALRASEMLEIIKNGYSKNEPVDFDKKSIFNFEFTVPQYVFITLDEEEELSDLLRSVADFTSKRLKMNELKVSSRMTLKNIQFVLVQKFDSIENAQEYINAYKAGYEHLDEFQDNKISIITQENLKKLIETSKFEEYNSFYMDNY